MGENEDSNIRIYQRKKDYWKQKDIEVVKYRNYGNTMTGEDGTRFYWSFYQLNNHQVICLQYIEYKDESLTPRNIPHFSLRISISQHKFS